MVVSTAVSTIAMVVSTNVSAAIFFRYNTCADRDVLHLQASYLCDNMVQGDLCKARQHQAVDIPYLLTRIYHELSDHTLELSRLCQLHLIMAYVDLFKGWSLCVIVLV